MTGKVLALLFGGSGKHCAAAVDDKDLCPRTLGRTGRKLADPPQVEGCDDNRRCDYAPLLHHRECSHHARNAADSSDEIVAQRKLTRMQGILEIGAIGNIQSEDRRVTSASHLAIVADDRQHAHPWNVARQVLRI